MKVWRTFRCQGLTALASRRLLPFCLTQSQEDHYGADSDDTLHGHRCDRNDSGTRPGGALANNRLLVTTKEEKVAPATHLVSSNAKRPLIETSTSIAPSRRTAIFATLAVPPLHKRCCQILLCRHRREAPPRSCSWPRQSRTSHGGARQLSVREARQQGRAGVEERPEENLVGRRLEALVPIPPSVRW